MTASPLDMLREVQQYTLLTRLIEALVITVAGIVFLYIVRKVLDKLSSTGGVDSRSINNMYKLIKTATTIVVFFLVLYTLTQASIIVLFILGTILIMLAASWEVIANVAAYYVILMNRKLGKGDYIEIRHGDAVIAGRIREINPFFTTLESQGGVYSVPNILVLRSPARIPGPAGEVEVSVRVWGIDDPDAARALLRRLEDEIATLSKPIVPSPRHLRVTIVLDEISSDSFTVRMRIPLPGRTVNREKFNRLLEDLAVTLKETGYSFSITLTGPEH